MLFDNYFSNAAMIAGNDALKVFTNPIKIMKWGKNIKTTLNKKIICLKHDNKITMLLHLNSF